MNIQIIRNVAPSIESNVAFKRPASIICIGWLSVGVLIIWSIVLTVYISQTLTTLQLAFPLAVLNSKQTVPTKAYAFIGSFLPLSTSPYPGWTANPSNPMSIALTTEQCAEYAGINNYDTYLVDCQRNCYVANNPSFSSGGLVNRYSACLSDGTNVWRVYSTNYQEPSTVSSIIPI